MKWLATFAVLVALGLATAGARAADEEEDKTSFWMRKKLEYSGQILEALAEEDYEQIAASARSMKALSHMERWVRASLPEYRTQLRIFTNANEQLIRAADHEQLDGAALAYVQLTLSCVNCHKVVRGHAAAGEPSRTK
jgi:cytochrome c556